MATNLIFKTTPSCLTCTGCADSLLGMLTKIELETLDNHKSYQHYKKGEHIFNEGNRPNGLFCIKTGKVKVYKLGMEGKEQIVRLAKPSSILGYRALLSDDTYYASATALEDTDVCFFPKSYYLDVITANKNLSLQTIKLLASDLRSAEKEILNMAQKNAKSRIAFAIITLFNYFGAEADNKTIKSKLKREDIGSMAGTTTETTIRVISDLNKDKIIRISGKKIIIEKMKELEKIAEIN